MNVCAGCITESLNGGSRACPICRTVLERSNPTVKARTLDNLLSEVKIYCQNGVAYSETEKTWLREVRAERSPLSFRIGKTEETGTFSLFFLQITSKRVFSAFRRSDVKPIRHLVDKNPGLVRENVQSLSLRDLLI